MPPNPTQPHFLTTHHPRILVPNTAMKKPRRHKHAFAQNTSEPAPASASFLKPISSHVIGTRYPARSVHAVPGPARGARSRKEKNERSPRHPRSLAPVLENQPHASFGVSVSCICVGRIDAWSVRGYEQECVAGGPKEGHLTQKLGVREESCRRSSQNEGRAPPRRMQPLALQHCEHVLFHVGVRGVGGRGRNCVEGQR